VVKFNFWITNKWQWHKNIRSWSFTFWSMFLLWSGTENSFWDRGRFLFGVEFSEVVFIGMDNNNNNNEDTKTTQPFQSCKSLRGVVNFTNILWTAFSNKCFRKLFSLVTVCVSIFLSKESTEKGAQKMLVKLTRGRRIRRKWRRQNVK